MGKNEQVNKHLIEYYKLCDELRAPQHFSQRMKAIHLKKTGVDFEAKAQAQKLFRDLLKQAEKDFSFHQKLTIIFHLIDLLLEEAKIFDNSSKMQEIIVLINQGTEMSQDNPRALIQIYLLQAKILLIEGKIDDSLSLLEKAHTLAMNKYLKPLAQEAKALQEELQSEYTKWKGIIESNTSLNERIAFSEVKGYIDDAIRIRDLGNKLPSKISQNDL
jgi:tetratricopeptide (TPR) repeat protein